MHVKFVGEKCPCGTWVTPAFHIQVNKVDQAIQRNIGHQQAGPFKTRPVVKPSQMFLLTTEKDKLTAKMPGEDGVHMEEMTIGNSDSSRDGITEKSDNLMGSTATGFQLVSEFGDAVSVQNSQGDLPPL